MHNRYQQRRRYCSGKQEEQQPPQKPAVREPCHRKENLPPATPFYKGPMETGRQPVGGPPLGGVLPPPLKGLLAGNRTGDLMALMILLLLLWEGREDSRGTVLTLLIFLLL